MNLFIFNEFCPAGVYGIETYIRELTATLKNSNINVCVVYLNSDNPQIKSEQTDDALYLHFPPPIQWSKELEEQWDLYHRNIVYLLQLHIKDKTNLIFHLNYNKKGRLAEELKKVFDCKIILTIHYLDSCLKLTGNLGRFVNILETRHTTSEDKKFKQLQDTIKNESENFQTVDHIICLSNKTQQILVDYYEINKNKISVIYNGLRDRIASNEESILRKKNNIANDVPIILYVGRLNYLKGLRYALQAFRIILKTHEDCRFIIAGNGEYDLHMLECEDIWMNISWTGLISKQKLYELYSIADIGLIPSFSEQCSYVAIEMMMHGLPLVGTSTGLGEMIVDHVTGLHIPVIEHTDSVEIDCLLLADKLLYLIQNKNEARTMGYNGRKRYLSTYSENIFRNNMLKLYESFWQSNDNKIKTLLLTGQNNHNWEVSHIAIKQILENSELFTVDIAISPKEGECMFNFKPNFASYQLVLLDYIGDRWSKDTEKSFLDFVEKGGGLVIYHSANNAFRNWKEYNQIIGFGGWENRDETDGPYIYMKEGAVVYDHKSLGQGGSHGYQHEFVLHCGNSDHPITNGLPLQWLHTQDELYDSMRGSGKIKDVLFWAHSDPETRGSGKNELAIFTVDYGKARIFHTTLGHSGLTLEDNMAMQCTGFQVTLLRGSEWAATGKVTQQVPDDFPTPTTLSLRKKYK